MKFALLYTMTDNTDDLFGHEHVTTIRPRSGWHMLDLKELWAYRELLWVFTMRDIKVRYKQTVLGVGTILSALTVTYRDFRFIVPFMVQIWMYLTPVVYGSTFIPEKWRWLLMLNPMTGYIDGFRAAFLGRPLDTASLAVSVIMTIALFLLGVAYFQKVERRFADVI